MNKNTVFGSDCQNSHEKRGFLNGNFMSLTLIYTTCVFLINVITVIWIFD